MAAETCKVEMFALVDNCGDYAVGKDEAAAREAYENEIQALGDCDGFRLVKITVDVPVPQIAELTGAVADVGTPGELVAK